MDNKTDRSEKIEKTVEEKKPDETATFQIDTHLKIFDPNSGEVFINKRD